MQILILAHSNDSIADHVAESLSARFGEQAVSLLFEMELACALCWSHEIDNDHIRTHIRTANGKAWDFDDVGVVFNRLRSCSAPLFSHASADDRSYAEIETAALWLSWLNAFRCPVVNPVSALGFGNAARSTMEWFAIANRAGLPTQDYVFATDPRRTFRARMSEGFSGDDSLPEWATAALLPHLIKHEPTLLLEPLLVNEQKTVWLIGDHIVGPVEDAFRAGMNRLRKLSRCDLLEVTLGKTIQGGEWKIAHVNSFPQTMNREATRTLADYLYHIAFDGKGQPCYSSVGYPVNRRLRSCAMQPRS